MQRPASKRSTTCLPRTSSIPSLIAASSDPGIGLGGVGEVVTGERRGQRRGVAVRGALRHRRTLVVLFVLVVVLVVLVVILIGTRAALVVLVLVLVILVVVIFVGVLVVRGRGRR